MRVRGTSFDRCVQKDLYLLGKWAAVNMVAWEVMYC